MKELKSYKNQFRRLFVFGQITFVIMRLFDQNVTFSVYLIYNGIIVAFTGLYILIDFLFLVFESRK